MSNIIDFQTKNPNKDKLKEHNYQGLSEEEYALTLLRLHRLESKIKDTIEQYQTWINQPSDPQMILKRMEEMDTRLTGGTSPVTPHVKNKYDTFTNGLGCGAILSMVIKIIVDMCVQYLN